MNEDRIRQWITSHSARGSTLSDETRIVLSRDYGIPRDAIARMASGIDHTLAINFHPMGASDPLAIKAKKELEEAVAHFEGAKNRLKKGIEKLKNVEFYYDNGQPQSLWAFNVAKEKLSKAALFWIIAMLKIIRSCQNNGQRLVYDGVPNKRKTQDERRHFLLSYIFFAWEASGQPLSLTYDPLDQMRSGRLVPFVNEIILPLMKIPDPMSGDSIRKDMDRYVGKVRPIWLAAAAMDAAQQN